MDAKIGAPSRPADDRELVNIIEARNYNAVIEALRSGSMDVNRPLAFRNGDKTGLEYSVDRNDWRMAAIFFVLGADPAQNELAGLLQMFDYSEGYDNPKLSDEPFDKPTFDGLRVLVGTDHPYSLAHLWLMETSHEGKLDLDKDFSVFLDSMEAIGEESFGRELCKRSIMTCILCMRRCGLSNNLAKRVVEEMILQVIWSFLEDTAFKDNMEDEEISLDEAAQNLEIRDDE